MCYRVVYLDKLVIEFRLDYAINLLIISICWIVFYAVVGNYNDIYRKSRLKEITQIFLVTLIGVTIIFFAVLLDDFIVNYKQYYSSFIALFCFHFIITSSFRFLLTTRTAFRIHNNIYSRYSI